MDGLTTAGIHGLDRQQPGWKDGPQLGWLNYIWERWLGGWNISGMDEIYMKYTFFF